MLQWFKCNFWMYMWYMQHTILSRIRCKNHDHLGMLFLSCQVEKSPISIKALVKTANNSSSLYLGSLWFWNFQGGSKGKIYAPCKNIVMLSCLVRKIQPPPPHFHVYGLLWSEKSSGLEVTLYVPRTCTHW